MSVKNLLYALLLHSSNEVANILAEYISGSVENFANLMNQKATELGCKNTHFVNPNGIQNENHYSTAYDMSLIAKYCMQNSTFRDFVSTYEYQIPATNKSGERTYQNTNSLINPSSNYYYKYCIGIKTGFTTAAKNCLISASKKDDMELIAVVLGASATSDGSSARYTDSINLFEYGFKNYTKKIEIVHPKGEVIKTVEIPNGTSDTKSVDLILSDDIKAYYYGNNSPDISSEISLKDDITAPIAQNTVLGSITYTIGEKTYTSDLVASHDVLKNDISYFIYIFLLLGIILIALIILLILHIYLKKKEEKTLE